MYDIIIIGAGTAGMSAYKEAKRQGKKILIINAESWETTCVRVGCMPSKIFISAANRLHDIKTSQKVGLEIKFESDTSHVMQHVRKLRSHFAASILEQVKSWDENDKVSGYATFVDQNTVEVDGKKYQAKSFVLAVGSTPNVDEDIKKELKEKYITTDDFFELKRVPKSIAIIGSGAIAIELAQALQRLEVDTTVFARSDKIGILTSENLQNIAKKEVKKELKILFETLPRQYIKENEYISLTYQDKENNEQTIKVDYVLSATGRKTLLSTLNLENIDSKFKDSEKLPIDEHTKQLGDYPIFVAGDAYTTTPVQHEASIEGRRIIENCIKYPDIKNIKTVTPLSIVFCSPEMAIVGQSYKTLTKHNKKFTTGFVSYENQGRSLILGKNKGGLEIYIDQQTRKILGAEIYVYQAEHFAHQLNWLISENITLEDFLEKPFYHPTMEEGIRTALRNAKRELDKTAK